LTTNELADRIRNSKSNSSQFKKIFDEKNAPKARFLITKCAAGKTYETKRAGGQIF